ncbi:uncharacterized protein LOC144764043 [Lissotriton helveticus]
MPKKQWSGTSAHQVAGRYGAVPRWSGGKFTAASGFTPEVQSSLSHTAKQSAALGAGVVSGSESGADFRPAARRFTRRPESEVLYQDVNVASGARPGTSFELAEFRNVHEDDDEDCDKENDMYPRSGVSAEVAIGFGGQASGGRGVGQLTSASVFQRPGAVLSLAHHHGGHHQRDGLEEFHQRASQLPAGRVSDFPRKKRTWIVGHSIVKWAAIFAEQQICGRGLDEKVIILEAEVATQDSGLVGMVKWAHQKSGYLGEKGTNRLQHGVFVLYLRSLDCVCSCSTGARRDREPLNPKCPADSMH